MFETVTKERNKLRVPLFARQLWLLVVAGLCRLVSRKHLDLENLPTYLVLQAANAGCSRATPTSPHYAWFAMLYLRRLFTDAGSSSIRTTRVHRRTPLT